jgi:hypothetical protein
LEGALTGGAGALSFTILTFQADPPSPASGSALLVAGSAEAALATSAAAATLRKATLKTTPRVPRLDARAYFGRKTLAV